MKYRYILVLLFLLTGCAQTGASLSAEGTYLLQASIDLIHRTHDKRRLIESECWRSVLRTVDKLRERDDEEAVRKFLLLVYPKLVTLNIIQKAKDNSEDILTIPPGCPVKKVEEIS